MVLCAKTDKAHRNVIHTSKLCFITLTPEISQRSHGKSSKRVFSCFPVFLLLKHRVICLLNHVKSFFLACLTQRCDSSVLWHKNRDRKSTRLNSSHVSISYAVFCLKKKKHIHYHRS